MDAGKASSTVLGWIGAPASGMGLEGKIVVAQSRSVRDRAPFSDLRERVVRIERVKVV
jgi:hypothetical protein